MNQSWSAAGSPGGFLGVSLWYNIHATQEDLTCQKEEKSEVENNPELLKLEIHNVSDGRDSLYNPVCTN